MQIFQWLFKVIPEQEAESITSHTKKITYGKDVDANIILYEKRGVYRRRSKRLKESDNRNPDDHHLGGNKYLKPFAFLRRKDVARTCFYNTLNLKRLGSINRRRWIHSVNKMKKDQEIATGLASTHHHHHEAHDSATAQAGNKVLPLSDAATNNEHCGTDTVLVENKKDDNNNNLVNKGDHKTKSMSRMKELLRWAAAAKSAEKGGKFLCRKVLHFRNRATLKEVADDEDQLSMESPKISLRWDVESNCSITSSVYWRIQIASSTNNIDQMMITSSSCNLLSSVSSTPIHGTPRKGNWITTDSEFVVLEL